MTTLLVTAAVILSFGLGFYLGMKFTAFQMVGMIHRGEQDDKIARLRRIRK